MEAFERLHNPPSIGWRPLLERYIEGEYGLHIPLNHHPVKVRSSDWLNSPYFCATFEWPRRFLFHSSELNFWVSTLNIMKPDEEEYEMKVAVLVDVPEFVQNRKRLFGRILPVVEWLQPLQLCADSWPDSPEATWWFISPRDAPARGVSLAGVEGVDGEADVPPFLARTLPGYHGGRCMPVGERELPDEMVERGTEIVNRVTYDCAPFVRKRLSEGFTVNSYLSGLDIRLGLKFVRATINNVRRDPFVQEA